MTTVDDIGQPAELDRGRLAQFADLLIAGGAGFPTASAVDVHGVWIDRVFAVRPDLAGVVTAVIDGEADPATVLAELRAGQRDTFDAFSYAIAGAYLINPRIRRLLGYPGSVPTASPAYPDEADAYLEDGILDVVINRGPIYRPTPAWRRTE